MEQEKIKEIKKALECCQGETPNCIDCAYWGNCKKDYGAKIRSDILTLINELESENEKLKKIGLNDNITVGEYLREMERLKKDNELLRNAKVVYENVDYCAEDLKKAEKKIAELESENERLRKEKEDLRLFDIALGNGKVDMTLGGDTAKSFINAIVQIFEQNNATNFLATTIETISSGNKYSLVIQKENGQTPSEKLTELKDRIAELEKENESLKNRITCKIVFPDEKLEKIKKRCIEQVYTDVKDTLKQFAERLKEKCEYNRKQYCCSATVGANDIDETLKEFLCEKYQ